MGIADSLYKIIYKRTSTFALATVVCAFAFEEAFDRGCDLIFETVNKGKLFKDLKILEKVKKDDVSDDGVNGVESTEGMSNEECVKEEEVCEDGEEVEQGGEQVKQGEPIGDDNEECK
ncbi:unnamed protein product [Brassicogethes aeneus]|uniref:Cytochrome b-c1 complex subunit 9 n=1 Tax=Brassicogethes aeneus TaxID=1431903 RepID=A0A9P0FKR6_BRAAE|nr:unnamed protein product [Brassicogethes aeneus]